MTITALLVSLALRSQAADKPTIQYYQGEFVIRSRGVESRLPLAIAKPAPPPFVAFRRDAAFAVWDQRGLTVRNGAKAASTKLPEIPVSPRVFSHEEILKTIQRINSGECGRNAAALSGCKRIGKDAYFLVRWEDKTGKPWTEALVQVDLTASKLKPELLGRFDGLSTATKPIDDKLMILDGKLAIVERSADSWGLSTYDPATLLFRTQPIGGTLVTYEPLNLTQGLFVEISSYGTTIAGRADLAGGTRKILYEGREQIRFVDTASPETVLAYSGGKTKVVNCVTGAVRFFPFHVDARRVEKQMLFWTPSSAPSALWLMAPQAWETLATWRQN